MPPRIQRGKRLPFSDKYKGELIEKLILDKPDFIAWLLAKPRLAQFTTTYEHVDACIKAFDAAPFTSACYGKRNERRCTEPVVRASLRPPSPDPYFWCATCSPTQRGAEGVLTIRTYREALGYVRDFCGGRRGDFRFLVKALYKAKGLAGRKSEEKILEFFHGA